MPSPERVRCLSDTTARSRAPSPAQAVSRARALLSGGRRAEAGALLRQVLYRESGHREARRLLAGLGPDARPRPRLGAEDRAIRQAVTEAVHAGQWRRVAELAAPLLGRQPLLGDMANALALALRHQSRPNEALRVLDHAIRCDPALPDSYVNTAMILRHTLQFDAALQAALAGFDVAPDLPAVRMALGHAHFDLEQVSEAETHLRRAAELDPANPLAHDALCRALALLNRLDDLDTALAEAETRCPGDRFLTIHRAGLLARRGDPEAALALLDGVDLDGLAPETRATAAATRARALDALGRYDDAFAAFAEMNARQARVSLTAGGDNPFPAQIEARLAGIGDLPRGGWAPEPDDGWTPVFLVGFPRSGTTLLDTLLRSHGACAVTEERPFVDRSLGRGIRPGQEAADLAALAPEARAARRAAYRALYEADLDAPLGGRRAVDRLPFNMLQAAVIARHFPGARFILALRHPCDCVLSCFMQSFASNPANDTFLDLATAAQSYDRAFTLWEACRERLGLDVVEVRYESVIDDVQAALTPVLERVGLDWHEGMRDHRATARNRKVIRTASHDQVTRALYRSAENRWRHYRKHMDPVLPVLAPWADRYGYEI